MPYHWELPDEDTWFDETYRRPVPDPGAPTLQEMIDQARRDSREGRTEELACYPAPRWWERVLHAVGRLIGRLVRYTKG